MNRRPGVDTHDPDFHLLVKVNLPFDDRDRAIEVLRAIQAVKDEKQAPDRTFGIVRGDEGEPEELRYVVADLRLNLLVAFGLRFFLGPLEGRGQEEVIPNFPPGGEFTPREPTRFDLTDRTVPLYLRTMAATGDDAFVAQREGLGPASEEGKAAYRRWLQDCESDLLLIFEAENLYLVIDFWDAVRKAVVEPLGLELVSVQQGLQRGDGRDHTGFHDGTSNLQDKLHTDPQYYRSKVYLPHPAPAYPGEPARVRDDPRYDGGTYLVHRKYVEDLDKWRSDDFDMQDHYGKTFKGDEARMHTMGRHPQSGRAISRYTDEELDPEPDRTEVNLAYNESHILKARGGETAPFQAPFPPLQGNESNVFNTQDIRIRRRGVNFSEIDPVTGEVTYGLHFICFQNNIQQLGFEFINNIWLMNPLFRRSKDPLFDPEEGIIEPVEGAYYFVPPEHREYPGDVFFQ